MLESEIIGGLESVHERLKQLRDGPHTDGEVHAEQIRAMRIQQQAVDAEIFSPRVEPPPNGNWSIEHWQRLYEAMKQQYPSLQHLAGAVPVIGSDLPVYRDTDGACMAMAVDLLRILVMEAKAATFPPKDMTPAQLLAEWNTQIQRLDSAHAPLRMRRSDTPTVPIICRFDPKAAKRLSDLYEEILVRHDAIPAVEILMTDLMTATDAQKDAAPLAIQRWAAKAERQQAKGAPQPMAAATGKTAAKLIDSERDAANYIRENPGAYGKDIATKINVTHEHFRNKIVPKLKAIGFTNPRKRGYHPPEK